jgi:hypothetical protein
MVFIMKINALFFCVLIFLISSCSTDKGPLVVEVHTTNAVVSYAVVIAPIITAKCAIPGCHNSGASIGDFSSYADLKNVATSGSLKTRVVVQKDMPVSGYPSLTEIEIAHINTWITQGALNN